MVIQGLDLKSIKKHPSLIPLYFVLAAGCTTAVLYTARLAIKNPDVSWSHKTKPEPWNDYKDKRYQLLDPAAGKRSLGHLERPKSIWD